MMVTNAIRQSETNLRNLHFEKQKLHLHKEDILRDNFNIPTGIYMTNMYRVEKGLDQEDNNANATVSESLNNRVVNRVEGVKRSGLE